jgi:hypothetical protein
MRLSFFSPISKEEITWHVTMEETGQNIKVRIAFFSFGRRCGHH